MEMEWTRAKQGEENKWKVNKENQVWEPGTTVKKQRKYKGIFPVEEPNIFYFAASIYVIIVSVLIRSPRKYTNNEQ